MCSPLVMSLLVFISVHNKLNTLMIDGNNLTKDEKNIIMNSLDATIKKRNKLQQANNNNNNSNNNNNVKTLSSVTISKVILPMPPPPAPSTATRTIQSTVPVTASSSSSSVQNQNITSSNTHNNNDNSSTAIVPATRPLSSRHNKIVTQTINNTTITPSSILKENKINSNTLGINQNQNIKYPPKQIRSNIATGLLANSIGSVPALLYSSTSSTHNSSNNNTNNNESTVNSTSSSYTPRRPLQSINRQIISQNILQNESQHHQHHQQQQNHLPLPLPLHPLSSSSASSSSSSSVSSSIVPTAPSSFRSVYQLIE